MSFPRGLVCRETPSEKCEKEGGFAYLSGAIRISFEREVRLVGELETRYRFAAEHRTTPTDDGERMLLVRRASRKADMGHGRGSRQEWQRSRYWYFLRLINTALSLLATAPHLPGPNIYS
jgi:hypothetical protein